ncbi:MAG: hypothetical protein PHW10_01695 [Candidatus Peribacteraceae bacterium]|nr:hypothetical protein [Candidatus Peribacteraceae bacterium]
MIARPLLPLFAVLLLSACAPSERQVKAELEKANRCEEAADCVLIGSKCPFDCYIYVHKDEAARMKAVVENFDAQCIYSCIQSTGVECEDNKCVAMTEEPAPLLEGNVGAACSSSDECQTPVDFLVRSNCPFGSACIDGSCAVVCPMPSPQPTVGWTQPVACSEDTDCDCGTYASNDMENCRCIDGACLAVMK